MKRVFLSTALLAFTFACAPQRDNKFDPSRAPSVVISVWRDGVPVLEGARRDALQIRFDGSRDPQSDPLTVDVFRYDPRTDEELVGSSCPRFAEATIGSVVWTGTEAITWRDWIASADPNYPCFESNGAGLRIALRAVARDPGGSTGSAEANFIFRNAAPVVIVPPTMWRDPRDRRPVLLSAGRSFDEDPISDAPFVPEDLDFTWSFLSGPLDLSAYVGFTEGPDLSIDLATIPGGWVPGSTYRFAVTATDGWQTADPAIVEMVLAPAVWMGAADQLSLLDPRWTEADQSLVGGASVVFPDLAEIVGGPDGIWMFSSSTPTVARFVRKNLITNTFVLPAGHSFQTVLGSDPASGTAWILANNGTNRVLSVGTAGALVEAGFDTTLAASAVVAVRQNAGSPLWVIASTRAARAFPGGALDTFALSGGCIDPGSLTSATVDATGDAWLVGTSSGTPSVMRVASAGGVESPCFLLGSATPNSIVWTPGGSGTGELLLGYSDRGMESLDPVDGIRVRGPALRVDARALLWDATRNRVMGSGEFATGVWAVGSYEAPIATSPIGNGLGLGSPGNTFALDRSGDAWLAYAYPGIASRLVRLPADTTLVRATLQGESFGKGTVAAVDPASGIVWIVRPTSDLSGLQAVAIDEQGPVPDPRIPGSAGAITPWTIPLPDGVIDFVVDPGDLTREPALWAITDPPDFAGYQVWRVGFDGALLAGYGGDAANGAVTYVLALMGRPTAPALDIATGQLWISIADGIDNGILRFDGAGTVFGDPLTFPSAMDFSFAPRPRGAIDAAGRYWTFDMPNEKVYLTTPAGGQTFYPPAATEICPDPGPILKPSALFYDEAANEIVVVCSEYFADTSSAFAGGLVRLRATVPITQRLAVTFGTNVDDQGFINPVDGSVWFPDGPTVRFYDRSLNLVRARAVAQQMRSSVTR